MNDLITLQLDLFKFHKEQEKHQRQLNNVEQSNMHLTMAQFYYTRLEEMIWQAHIADTIKHQIREGLGIEHPYYHR